MRCDSQTAHPAASNLVVNPIRFWDAYKLSGAYNGRSWQEGDKAATKYLGSCENMSPAESLKKAKKV